MPRPMERMPAVAVAVAPFVFLAAVLHILPLPPYREGPVPWAWAAANAAFLLVAFTAHAMCYARWQPHAPGRMLANELMARLWLALYGVLVVGLASPNGFLLLWVALPWAALSWEVHRQDVRRNGYRVAWNLGSWGVYLLGLGLMEFMAVTA